MNNSQVARILKTSRTTVLRLIRDGKLHPVRTGPEVVHDPEEVDALKLSGWTAHPSKGRSSGGPPPPPSFGIRLSQNAFRMFANGQSAWDVVVELGVEPSTAAELQRIWRLGPDGLARENDEKRQIYEAEKLSAEMRRSQKRDEWMRWKERMKKIPSPPRT